MRTTMTKIILGRAWLLILFVFVNVVHLNEALAATEGNVDSLQILSADFKESIRAHGNEKYSIEFCPDNTCDLFVAKQTAAADSFGDFIYLYLYFFSDYYVLSEWRAKPDATATMKIVLSNRKYDRCHSSNDREKARCVERYLVQAYQIKLYAVRYDEKLRHIQRKGVYKATSH